jgi:hypothetical protein
MGKWGELEQRNLSVRNKAQNATLIEQNARIIALLEHQNETLDWLAQEIHRRAATTPAPAPH